jgi:hypothetical protein
MSNGFYKDFKQQFSKPWLTLPLCKLVEESGQISLNLLGELGWLGVS